MSSQEAKQRQKAAAAEQAKQMVGKIFTKAELAGFNGSDESVPVYISVAGHVLDVSGSRNLFGRGKPRGCWSGRDATMAIIAKTCDEKELARSWSSAQQHETTQLEQSLQFFLSKYPKVTSHARITQPHNRVCVVWRSGALRAGAGIEVGHRKSSLSALNSQRISRA